MAPNMVKFLFATGYNEAYCGSYVLPMLKVLRSANLIKQ